MDRNKNLSTTLDEVNMNELESNFDARYIKGIFDAFQYVGGDLSESIGKQGESVSQNSSEILHTIKSLTSPRPLNKEVSALKLDVLTQQANLSKQSNKIKTVSSKLDEKKDEIVQLRNQLEKKNIMVSFKDNEIAQLSAELSWNTDPDMNSTMKLRQELRTVEEQLAEKQEEVHIMRKELEQRNICLSTVKAKIDSVQ
jgi:chromosome segregation ATPase